MSQVGRMIVNEGFGLVEATSKWVVTPDLIYRIQCESLPNPVGGHSHGSKLRGQSQGNVPRGTLFSLPPSSHLDPTPELETSPDVLKATILGRQGARTAKTSRDPSTRPERQLLRGHSKPMVTPFFACVEFDKCIPLH